MYCPNCGTASTEGQSFCVKCGTKLDAIAARSVPSPPAAGITSPYSNFWRRAAAFLIDIFILLFIYVLILAFASGPNKTASPIAPLLFFVAVWVYFAGMESSKLQATIGKLALGIKVTDLQGRRIGFGRATGREFARILSGMPLYIGYVVAGFTKRRQAFHDMIAGTLVVNKRCSSEEVATAGPAPTESSAAVALIVVVIAFGFIFVIGILAAIAIPAYQTYTIRAQVTEGLMLANDYKAAVSEAIARGQQPSTISMETLNISAPSSGKYVDSLKVVSGAIAIKYGRAANSLIAGKILVIVPAVESGNQNIVWTCGHATTPGNATPSVAGASKYTTVADQFLPISCRQ